MAEREIETELIAIDHCVKALESLNDDARQRALRYLNGRFLKVEPTQSLTSWGTSGISAPGN